MIYEPIPTKRCTKCRDRFPGTLEYFTLDNSNKTKLHTQCRTCRSKATAKWLKEHPEYHRQMQKTIGRRYPERIRQRNKQYQTTHLDKFREGNRKYHHSARGRANHKARMQRRHARIISSPGQYTTNDVLTQYHRQKGCCYYCGQKVGDNYHVDHVVPLSRGGTNTADNIVIACPHCNLGKHNKMPHEWPEGGRLC